MQQAEAEAAAADLIVDLTVLPVDRWHMPPLLPRMWELRDNLTPYDAAYVALAELSGAILVTGAERIAAAPGARNIAPYCHTTQPRTASRD